MNNRKACIVFAFELEEKAKSISKQLSEEGFNVCAAATNQEVVKDAKAGSSDIPEEVKSCIEGAEICVFLIPKQDSTEILGAANYAGSSGKKIVAVLEDLDYLPQIFDDIAISTVHIESPKLTDALKGKSIWECPTGPEDGKRKISRVKCQ